MNEKIYKVADNIYCTVAGITSDANVLVEKLRETALNHYLQYGENIPVEQLVIRLCNIKQHYTQIGGIDFNLLIYQKLVYSNLSEKGLLSKYLEVLATFYRSFFY